MVRSGVPQSVAMKISGHRTASMFRRYDIADEGDLRQAIVSIQKYRKAQTEKVVHRRHEMKGENSLRSFSVSTIPTTARCSLSASGGQCRV